MALTTSLKINQLELPVTLGWSEEERKRQQSIYLDVEMTGVDFAKACESNNLADTICYDVLSQKLRDFTRNREFKLIENLTLQVYDFIKGRIPKGIRLKVVVTKPNIPVEGLHGGASFIIAGK